LAKPSAGGGTVLGRDIVAHSTDIRGRIGFLAQEPRFYEHLTARETLRFAARFFYGGPSPAIESRVEEMLDLVGLAERADRPVRGFSGGERQRLGIAQAQVNHPELLLMDEPASALDPMGRHAVLSILERLRGRATVLYSTHILDDVERVSDHVAILDRGRLLAQAPTRQLLSGDGETTFEVVVRGPAAGVAARLASLPWVLSLGQETVPEGTRFAVSVHDDEAPRRSCCGGYWTTPRWW
jgi:ABC-2 type transport system ATP-binding protein